VFVAIQQRVAHPLLPLRIVLDRDRGGSYLAMGLSAIAMFGVFLFLTYYLQQNLGFSPIKTGLGFLPMTFAIMVTATGAQTQLIPRFGPRPLIGTGLALGAVGMLLLTGIGVDSSYASHVLPGLLVMGVGLGLVFAPAMSSATLGVEPGDAGVASATVNTMQQIGGSIGTALLSTLAASATTGAIADAGTAPTKAIVAQAAIHGYTTAFYWSAAIFAVAAVVCTALLRSGVHETSEAAEPVFAH
jgi:MFS family permease